MRIRDGVQTSALPIYDALPLLIFEDGVGQVIGLFEQHMAEPKLRGARGGAEPGRTRADDGDPNRLAHAAAAPTVLPSIVLTQARTGIPPPSPSPWRPIFGCDPDLCRTEDRRVGKACVSLRRSRWSS